MRNAAILLAVVLMVAGAQAHAALAAYDGFDYTADGSIDGQGGAGDGWAGAWTDDSNGTITSPGMSYSTLSVEGLKATHDGGNAYRVLDTARGAAGTTTWISFIAQASSSAASSNWAGFSLFDGGTEKLWFGKSWAPTNWSVQDAVGANTPIESTVIATDQVFVLIRIDFSANDDIKVWINKPLDSQPLDSAADISLTSAGNNAFDRIRLCSGNDNTLDFDEVRIGDTWSDVTVPEPATMALLGIGGIGVLLKRRRKSRA